MTEKTAQILLGFEPASFAIVGNSDLKMISPKRNCENHHPDNPLRDLMFQSVNTLVPELCREDFQVCTFISNDYILLSFSVYLSSTLDPVYWSFEPAKIWIKWLIK